MAPPAASAEPLRLSPEHGILTIDLEHWHSVSCVPVMRYLLGVLRELGATATFFVVGCRAEAIAEVLREARADGHEIASHGWIHKPPAAFTLAEFREELKRSQDVLSGIAGAEVIGYRSPLFGVVAETMWALDVLVELGFRYDSSVFPFAGGRYGIAGFPAGPSRVQREAGSIIELPPSTVAVAGRKWPVAGGGYFRLLPYPIIRAAVKAVQRDGRPFVAYCHPYEFDPRTLHYSEVDGLGWLKARSDEMKTNLWRRGMADKVTRLLKEFTFTSVERCLAGGRLGEGQAA